MRFWISKISEWTRAMNENFWHRRWEQGETAFHVSEANPLLVTYFKELSLPEGSRVFLPLCGKTRDMAR